MPEKKVPIQKPRVADDKGADDDKRAGRRRKRKKGSLFADDEKGKAEYAEGAHTQTKYVPGLSYHRNSLLIIRTSARFSVVF